MVRNKYRSYQVLVGCTGKWSRTEFMQLKNVQSAKEKHEKRRTAIKEPGLILSSPG